MPSATPPILRSRVGRRLALWVAAVSGAAGVALLAILLALEQRVRAEGSVAHLHLAIGALLFVAWVLMVGFILWVSDRLVTQPVRELALLMQKAERGDFLVRATFTRDDELSQLGAAFNRMLAAMTALKAAEIEREADLRHAREELGYRARLAQTAAQLQASNALLARRVHAQELLMEAAHRLGSTLERSELLDRFVSLVREKLSWKHFALLWVSTGHDGEVELRVARAHGSADIPELRATRFRIGQGITGAVAESGSPRRVAVLSEEREADAAERAAAPVPEGALCAIPMVHHGRVVGVMNFFAQGITEFDDDTVTLLHALGAQLAMAVVNADLYEVTRELSVTDPLTQQMNRRALQRRLEFEFMRADRYQSPLALLMIDVDHFKAYNDRMGHLAGDEALRAVARCLAASVRKVDAVARYGGEEFCVVLPQTGEASAIEVAEKVRAAVAALDVPGGGDQPLGHVSISVGIGVYPDHMPATYAGPAWDDLLHATDRALYEAKARGRNTWVLANVVR